MSTEVNETTPSSEELEPVLQFRELDVSFRTEFGRVQAVKGVSLAVKPGEVVALVGESGSGKSVTATTALGLLPRTARITGDTMVADKTVGSLSSREMRGLRGNRVAMVFQEPMTALNPVIKIGEQLTESMEVHNVAHGEVAWQKAIDLLKAVGIPNAERRVKQYPHELSGGMRQRVVIAMALACDPEVIIADEPTTALDVTVQADILDLLRSLKEKLNTGILLITHNMGVVADMADRVAVMFKGNIVERGTAEEVLLNPQHPYTKKLLDAVPHLGAGHGQFGSVPSDVAENATSALDVSVQAQVLGMLTDLQRDFGFACLFISHDLAVIDSLAHRVVVMQHGKIVEKGDRAQVLLDPQEEYTKRLLAAAPVPNPIEQRERREERHRLLAALGDEVVELDTRELDQ